MFPWNYRQRLISQLAQPFPGTNKTTLGGKNCPRICCSHAVSTGNSPSTAHSRHSDDVTDLLSRSFTKLPDLDDHHLTHPTKPSKVHVPHSTSCWCHRTPHLGDRAIGAVFFAMQNREYLTTDKPGRTKKLELHDLVSRTASRNPIPITSQTISEIASVSQKHRCFYPRTSRGNDSHSTIPRLGLSGGIRQA